MEEKENNAERKRARPYFKLYGVHKTQSTGQEMKEKSGLQSGSLVISTVLRHANLLWAPETFHMHEYSVPSLQEIHFEIKRFTVTLD
jgi:hypothetical protein